MSMTVNFPERDPSRAERIPTQGPVEYEQPTSELDFWWLFNTIRRRLKLLVGLVVFVTVCTGAYVSTLTPVYRAETRLVIEGDRERVQAYEGVVIARSNRGLNSSFTVRKISHGEGVERTFQSHSPAIADVTIKRRGNVRRAKLYYLRDLSGKAARIEEKV